jgi:hypothetical protein
MDKRWTVQDRYQNDIYISEQVWEHIIAPENHPEMADYEEYLRETLQKGHRRQDLFNPRKYRYSYAFDDLCEDNTHLVAIVLFGFTKDRQLDRIVPNNYVVTAFLKEIG